MNVFCQDRRTVSAPEVGRQLRALRTGAGRTVASVAADAGLSVPYIANLENGRGNPTIAALGQLASALGMRLAISLVPAGEDAGGPPAAGGVPGSLVRLGRTDRFRRAAQLMAAQLGADEPEFRAQLVDALATLGGTLRRDLGEADWWRLLDALLLVAACPASG
jgi:transcriptional regulator with XRE-family HTH domain